MAAIYCLSLLAVPLELSAAAQCVLTPPASTVPAGSSATISASGAPGGEAFFLISAGPNKAEGSGLTSVGAWTYRTTHGIGTDTVTASGTFQGQTFSCVPAFVTWTPPTCTLAPLSATAPPTSPQTLIATVLDGAGSPVGDTKVSFLVTNGPNTGKNSGFFPPTTDAAGKVSFSYETQSTGTDTVVASGFYGSVAYSCSAAVTWAESPFACSAGSQVAVTLPLVMYSPKFTMKPVRVTYGELPLTFTVSNPTGTVCEAESSQGALTLQVGAMNGPQIPVAQSKATAKVTVFEPGAVTAKPPCLFLLQLPGSVTNDCILDGQEFDSQATYLRWSTGGFDVSYLPYISLANPPLPDPPDIPEHTFWVNLTQRGLDRSDIATVLQRVEPDIHRRLMSVLPNFAFLTVLFDPGDVELFVIDRNGWTTGTLPDGRKTNDILSSFIYDVPGNPGVFVLGTLEAAYMVVLTGARSSEFNFSVVNIAGDIAASQKTTAGSISKAGTVAFRVTTSAKSGTPLQTITASRLIKGDLNGDERVDCADVAVVTASFGKRVGQAGFNAWADIRANGIVDSHDLAVVTKRLPRRLTCPP